MKFEESEQSKIFPNAAFGYWKVTIERPRRLRVELDDHTRSVFKATCAEAGEEPLTNVIDEVAARIGSGSHLDYNVFLQEMETLAGKTGVKLTSKRLNLLESGLARRDEAASPVIKKHHKSGKAKPDPLHGLFESKVESKTCVVEYEPDSELRDTEQVPLLEPGGVDAFVQREVLPHVPDAWIDESSTKIGYEITFTRYFYKPQPLRSLEEIRSDIVSLEKESEGLLGEIIGKGD